MPQIRRIGTQTGTAISAHFDFFAVIVITDSIDHFVLASVRTGCPYYQQGEARMIDVMSTLTDAELNGIVGGVMKTCTIKGIGIDLPNGGVLIILNIDCGNGHLIPSATYVPPK